MKGRNMQDRCEIT